MAYKYGRPGPPFNFLGTMAESQKTEFYKWIDKRTPNFDPIRDFHRVRAHQFRKLSGMMEEFYKSEDPLKRNLKPTFEKETFKPVEGHTVFNQRDDRNPANTVYDIKDRMQDQFALDDEAVFRMNWVRNRFEAHEDMAQEAKEGASLISKRKSELDGYFANPHYRGALVKTADEKRFRVHPFDPPTPGERRTTDHVLPAT